MLRHRISPDRSPGDFSGTCCPDPGDDLRILIAEHGAGRHDDARVDIFLQHVFRDTQMLVLFPCADIDVRDGPYDLLCRADVHLQALRDIK